MRRVLFVDDEPLALDGLRNVLRRQRHVWDMSFVGDGEQALATLARQPHDAVVSEMHMPGMDGAQLLREVRVRHPGTARIVLTGQGSSEELARALPVAQQILSKPCDPKMLCAVLERLFHVQSLFDDERLRTLVGGLDHLPVFPECYDRLADAMHGETASLAAIAAIVERDPALSVAVLSMANAARFGNPEPMTSIQTAVRCVGTQLLSFLTLNSDLLTRIDDSLLESTTLRVLPECSQLRAQLAREFVGDRARADEAFAAGLLLDVGKIVLAQGRATSYASILADAESEGRALHAIERERLGYSHAEAGAYLLGVWGLPPRWVEAVACHHRPDWPGDPADSLAVALHVADVLADALLNGRHDPLDGLALAFRERADVAPYLPGWLLRAKEWVRP